ncbi:GntR family transcriptional regulator [Egibacter rhizosphaerae]|uniref:GntR family transcriptional regulator n=1 Tax=Egibacter rhizosphaerae TaxID=1670831 RepID=A0A411YJS4_9ACTN|nr:GntR family transcriptional regulator [Egibacter rhizosphaerae]QBI21443.1 GntR family transcriptional regulator [Egibacter rhizosphaerae]
MIQSRRDPAPGGHIEESMARSTPLLTYDALVADGTPAQGRRTAHQYVRETLRRAILGRSIPAGSRLVQADIAAQLDVSTTPVREALRELASEGLVQVDPHRGAIVAELDLDEMREIYELRLVLEPYCMRRAAEHITPDELEQAEAFHAEMASGADVGSWVELNRRFHGHLTDACRNARLRTTLHNLQDAAAAYVGLGLHQDPEEIVQGIEDHRRLLDAFQARDPEEAARITEQHLLQATGRLGIPDPLARPA